MKPQSRMTTVAAWLLAFAGLLCSEALLPAAQFDSTEWEFQQDVDVPTAQVLKLALPSTLLGASRGGLVDLRLTDPDGNIVPFLVQHPVARRAANVVPKSTRVTLEANSTVVLVQTGTTSPTDAVTLQGGTGRFLKGATVEGSIDGTTWRLLRRGAPIFNAPAGPSQMQVEFVAGGMGLSAADIG